MNKFDCKFYKNISSFWHVTQIFLTPPLTSIPASCILHPASRTHLYHEDLMLSPMSYILISVFCILHHGPASSPHPVPCCSVSCIQHSAPLSNTCSILYLLSAIRYPVSFIIVSCILYPVSYFQSPVSPVLHLVSFHVSSILSFILEYAFHTVASILQPALLTCKLHHEPCISMLSCILHLHPASCIVHPSYDIFYLHPGISILHYVSCMLLHLAFCILHLLYCILHPKKP